MSPNRMMKQKAHAVNGVKRVWEAGRLLAGRLLCVVAGGGGGSGPARSLEGLES